MKRRAVHKSLHSIYRVTHTRAPRVASSRFLPSGTALLQRGLGGYLLPTATVAAAANGRAHTHSRPLGLQLTVAAAHLRNKTGAHLDPENRVAVQRTVLVRTAGIRGRGSARLLGVWVAAELLFDAELDVAIEPVRKTPTVVVILAVLRPESSRLLEYWRRFGATCMFIG